MPLGSPLFVYLQFVYKFVCFFRQKAAIKVKYRDSGVPFDYFAVIITFQIYYSTIHLICQRGKTADDRWSPLQS